jgi:hypothetical protein
LPPEWFAEGIKESSRAKSIDETKEKLAPICHYALEEWYPKAYIRVTDDYVFVGSSTNGFKVSRRSGGVWLNHYSPKRKPESDLLNMFEAISGIKDDRECWRKLDAIRIRIEQENPKVLARRDKERETRERDEQLFFLSQMKKVISGFIQETGRTSPPPKNGKRAKKTARAYWEWIYPPDSIVTADHVKAAFEHWEKNGDDLYFRVKSTVYSKLTTWDLTVTGVNVPTKPKEL